MTTEAKVGLFTMLALAMLAFVVIRLGGYGFGGDSGYEVQAVFAQVDGLKQGNLVRYAGVDVGKVSRIEPDGKGARVTLKLVKGVQISSGALFAIGSDGLMGEKFVNIYPGEETSVYLKQGDVVDGFAQRGLDNLIGNADDVLLELQKLVKTLNEILGDDRFKASLVDSAINAKQLTENLNRMSAIMARMALNNEQDVRDMVRNLSMMSGNMANAAMTVDRMLADVDNGGQTAADLKAAIGNLSTTSQRIENMAVVLEGVVTDPETADNLKATLRNARDVSEKADHMMQQVSGISTEVNTELLYSTGADQYMTNAEVRLNTLSNDFLLLGVDDIGESNRLNLQIGKSNDKFAGRVGVFDDKAGIGVDAYVNPAFTLSVEAYDPNDVRVKLRAQYEFAPNTFLVGQTVDINKSEDRTTFIGVRKGF